MLIAGVVALEFESLPGRFWICALLCSKWRWGSSRGLDGPEPTSATVWAGDDWGSLESENYSDGNARETDASMEKQNLLGEMRSGADQSREVKIRIPRKELEKLVVLHGKGLSGEQVLSRLINGGNRLDLGPHLEHQRSWRPVLQSIPEVDKAVDE